MKFSNYNEVSAHLLDATIAALPKRPEIEVKEGYSNVSCSTYLSVTFLERDEDGDYIDVFGGCKVRFSDHRDRHGSDMTIRVDGALEFDELGDVELADWRIDDMIAESVTFVEEQLKEQSHD